jgi:hypothetical protein
MRRASRMSDSCSPSIVLGKMDTSPNEHVHFDTAFILVHPDAIFKRNFPQLPPPPKNHKK